MQYNVVAGIGCRGGGRMVVKNVRKVESQNKANSKSAQKTTKVAEWKILNGN